MWRDISDGTDSRSPSLAANGAYGLAFRIRGLVSGRPVDDLLGADVRKMGGAGLVGEKFHMFAEPEHLLLRVEQGLAIGIGDGCLAGERHDLEAQAKGVANARKLLRNIIRLSGKGRGLVERNRVRIAGHTAISCAARVIPSPDLESSVQLPANPEDS